MTQQPAWMSPQEVADYLGVELKAVWGYEAAKLITAIAPHGRGPGKRVYFHRDDIAKFAKTGVAQRARRVAEKV